MLVITQLFSLQIFFYFNVQKYPFALFLIVLIFIVKKLNRIFQYLTQDVIHLKIIISHFQINIILNVIKTNFQNP